MHPSGHACPVNIAYNILSNIPTYTPTPEVTTQSINQMPFHCTHTPHTICMQALAYHSNAHSHIAKYGQKLLFSVDLLAAISACTSQSTRAFASLLHHFPCITTCITVPLTSGIGASASSTDEPTASDCTNPSILQLRLQLQLQLQLQLRLVCVRFRWVEEGGVMLRGDCELQRTFRDKGLQKIDVQSYKFQDTQYGKQIKQATQY